MLRHAVPAAILSDVMHWRTQEFCSGVGGFQQIQLRTEDRENGVLGVVVRGSGGSCNLVQEISFHIIKFS